MDSLIGQGKPFDAGEQQTSNQLVQRIRKLRWIGMDEEADGLLAQLTWCSFRPTDTVIAGPWATD